MLHRNWLAVGLSLLGATFAAIAAEPPAAPQLRIEAGMHTAVINRIATDAQGRWAVTASDDKTARMWDVGNGRQLRVLRPPIDAGSEGNLYAVAMSPDGAVVATAGWTELNWYGKFDVYLFGQSTGKLLVRITGLPSVITNLTVGQHGRWLAATMRDGNGVRVLRWAEDSPPMWVADYGGGSCRAQLGPASPEGQPLVTNSDDDGNLRLYHLPADALPGSCIKPSVAQAAPGGKDPWGLYFSPDGLLLAVGYNDTTRADALEWLQRKPWQFGVSMMSVGGHDVIDPAMGYFFQPVNADPDALKRTAVSWADFKSTVLSKAGKRVVFMDTCRAGNALGTTFKAPYNDITGVLADLASAENGVVVFASSTGRQLSIQDAAWGKGAFTKALVEGLNGAAGTNARSEITHKRLSLYISDRVRYLTRGRQSPVNPDPMGVQDFALALAGK